MCDAAVEPVDASEADRCLAMTSHGGLFLTGWLACVRPGQAPARTTRVLTHACQFHSASQPQRHSQAVRFCTTCGGTSLSAARGVRATSGSAAGVASCGVCGRGGKEGGGCSTTNMHDGGDYGTSATTRTSWLVWMKPLPPPPRTHSHKQPLSSTRRQARLRVRVWARVWGEGRGQDIRRRARAPSRAEPSSTRLG